MKKPEDFQSLGHYIFDKLGGQFRDKIIFIDVASGREWTGQQMMEKIVNVAKGLKDLHGFEQGQCVCISYDNSDLTLILALAVISLGGIVASAYSKDPYAELLYLARKVEPKYLFCHANILHWAKQLETDIGYPVIAIKMEQLPAAAAAATTTTKTRAEDINHFHHLYNYSHHLSVKSAPIPTPCKSLELDVSIIIMSSGTTGKPKAIPVTHSNCIGELISLEMRDRANKRPADIRFACSASLDYVSGRLILFGSIAVGYTSVIMDGFEPRAYLSAIERYKISIVYLGAASFYNLITYQDLDQYDITSVKIIFPMGAKIIYLEELGKFFAKHPHIVQVKQGFGASELAGGAMKTMTPSEYLENSECCGQMLPGMEAKIVDPESGQRVVEPNKPGMLHMRGPTMFPGYYDIERVRCGDSSSPFICDETVFDHEHFYITGDVAYLNEQQELFIVGRQKETMCCRAGKKVLPQELEEVIERHEAVSKVCVLGIANKTEVTLHCPRAFVVPRLDFCSNRCNDSKENSANGSAQSGCGHRATNEELKFTGTNKLCRRLESDQLRRALMIDIMNFVNERVGWEKQLTGGLVLLDDMQTLRETGKVNKSYLRSLTLDQIELYGDRSALDSAI